MNDKQWLMFWSSMLVLLLVYSMLLPEFDFVWGVGFGISWVCAFLTARKFSRSRRQPEVGSTGAAGDEDGAKGSERDCAVVYEWSPPLAGFKPMRAEPPSTVQGRCER